MNRKIKFTALLITLLVVLSGCIKQNAVFREKPAQEEEQVQDQKQKKPLLINEITKDWQEYESEQYGYKIKFPSDWQKHNTYPKPNISPEIIFSNISEDQRNSQPYAIFSISIEEAEDRNLNGYNIIGDLVMEGYNKSTLEISNTQAALLITDDDNKDLASIFILRDGYFYRLTWNATTRAYRAQFEEIFKQIIATFKFTNKPVIDQKWI